MKGDARDKFDVKLFGRPALPSLSALEREKRLLAPMVGIAIVIGLTLTGLGFGFGADVLIRSGIVMTALAITQYLIYGRKLKKQLAKRRALNAESAARNRDER